MTTGYVLFRLAARTFATPLDEVREIVRLDGIETLPGARPPLAGVIVLRGVPLPVLDVRTDRSNATVEVRGDVLVMDVADDTLGVAVDQVIAVLPPEELPEAAAAPRSLPSYVVGVRRYRDEPVLLVDLQLLLDATAVGWESALTHEPV
jgi:chemotaxis signal transduction protein